MHLLLTFLFLDVIPYSNVAFFGEGEGAVHMDYVACTGDELDLLNCTHQKLSRFIINPHALDAGVRCFNLTGMIDQR